MIKIENTDIHGWEAAIRGMRNAYESWDKSDSEVSYLLRDDHSGSHHLEAIVPHIGPNDLKLMSNLAKAGPDHGKFLRMINVTCDITAPLYWWKEFRTYRAGVRLSDEDSNDAQTNMLYDMDIEMNSCSTMHKIHAKEFTLDDFSHEQLVGFYSNCLKTVIKYLNGASKMYLETGNKQYWWQMIQLLPSSYNQKRTVQLNYQVLKNMYFARKLHKLDEWREFCRWIETLPYFRKIVLEESE